jgi:hypothetical protein
MVASLLVDRMNGREKKDSLCVRGRNDRYMLVTTPYYLAAPPPKRSGRSETDAPSTRKGCAITAVVRGRWESFELAAHGCFHGPTV